MVVYSWRLGWQSRSPQCPSDGAWCRRTRGPWRWASAGEVAWGNRSPAQESCPELLLLSLLKKKYRCWCVSCNFVCVFVCGCLLPSGVSLEQFHVFAYKKYANKSNEVISFSWILKRKPRWSSKICRIRLPKFYARPQIPVFFSLVTYIGWLFFMKVLLHLFLCKRIFFSSKPYETLSV